MDKYEFNIKVEQIKKVSSEGDYVTAMKIADSIDWSRVRNANLLSMVAGVYEKNGEYQEAKDILLLAFERAPVGKRLLYKLTELSVKSGDIEEAEDYYREFVDIAPEDTRAFLLEYQILKAKGAPAAQLINSLEKFTSQELEEKWLYELAELYARAGMGAECVRVCDKITLLFGLGKYSERALMLKQNFTDLSDYQRDLVENRGKYENKLRAVEAESAQNEAMYERGYEALEHLEGEGEASYKNEKWDPDELAQMRYEDEDAAFEAYLRAHNMTESGEEGEGGASYEEDEASYGSEPAAFEAEAEPSVSYDEEYINEGFNEGFSETLSEEVNKLVAEAGAEDAVSAKEELGKTRVLDEDVKEKLRKVIIKADGEEALAQAFNTDMAAAKKGAMQQAAAIAGAAASAAKEASEAVADVGRSAEKSAAAAVETAAETAAEKTAETKGAAGAAGTVNAVGGTKEKTAAETAHAEGGEAAPAAEHAAEKAAEPAKKPEPPRPQARVGFTHTEPKKETAEETEAKIQAKSEAEQTAAQLDEAASENGPFHMIIEAETAKGGLEIAIDELKYLHTQYGITNAAAKTTAEKLNEKGFSPAAVEKLRGKDFIIEHAGALKEENIELVYDLMKTDTTGMIIVLVDTPEGLDRLEDICPEIFDVCDVVSDEYEEDEDVYAEEADAAETYEDEPYEDDADAVYEEEPYEDDAAYDEEDEYEEPARPAKAVKPSRASGGEKKAAKTSIVKAPAAASDEEMEIDDFAQYCCQYAASIDCSITGKSMLALYERIELMEEDNIPLTKETAEDLIEEAADRAEKPPIGKRLKGMFNSKYDKNGLLILREEDFIH